MIKSEAGLSADGSDCLSDGADLWLKRHVKANCSTKFTADLVQLPVMFRWKDVVCN